MVRLSVLISNLFLLVLLVPATCDAMGPLRRSFEKLSVVRAPAVRAFTSTRPLKKSFAKQQQHSWQQSKVRRFEESKSNNCIANSSCDSGALITLLEKKDWETAIALLDAGVRVDGTNKDDRTALILAIIGAAPLGVLEKILVCCTAEIISQKDQYGLDAYVYASLYAPASRKLGKMLYAVQTTGQLPQHVVEEATLSTADLEAAPPVLQSLFEKAELVDE